MPVIIDGTLGVNAAAITTTNWTPTNIATGGNTTLGDASADTVTINAGNTTFAASGARILGDFSNATTASRVAFQSSTTDGTTNIFALPNGVSTSSYWAASNTSDVSSTSLGSFGYLRANATSVTVGSQRLSSSGAWLPLTFYTSNAEAMRIDAAGNVGIGAVNPAGYNSKLAVVGSSGTVQSFTISGGSTSSDVGVTGAGAAGGSITTALMSYGDGRGYVTSNASTMYVGTTTASPISLITNYVERLRIDSSGNIGIGTSSPVAKLSLFSATSSTNGVSLQASGWNYYSRIGMIGSVGGDVYWTGNWNPTGTYDSSSYGTTYINNSPYNAAIIFGTGGVATAPVERMRITGDGNVGIGTSTPSSAKLSINQTSTSAGAIYAVAAPNQNGYAFLFGIAGITNGYYMTNDGSNNINHIWNGTGGYERMRIDAAGNVGIGTQPSTWFTSGQLQGASFGISQIAGVDQTAWTTGCYQPTYTGTWKHRGSYNASMYVQTGSSHVFYTDNSSSTGAGTDVAWNKVIEVATNRSLALQGASTQAGIGITFPSTQSASSDANTLDDYEEGTFTPTITGSGGAVSSQTFSGTARYIKVGKLVFIQIGGSFAYSGGSGDFALTNLPFPINTTSGTPSGGGAPLFRAVTWTGSYPSCHFRSGTNNLEFWGVTNGGNYTRVPLSGFSSTFEMYFSYCYEASN